jgi:hypothetical protein
MNSKQFAKAVAARGGWIEGNVAYFPTVHAREQFERDSGSGAQAMRPEGAQPVGPQSGGEQPHRPNSVKAG